MDADIPVLFMQGSPGHCDSTGSSYSPAGSRRLAGVCVEMTKDGLLASSQVRSRGYGTDDDE